jgi:hypothetical protein
VENVKKETHSGNYGNYTCAPSNAKKTSIMVHVVDDESGPAAMQHGNSANNLKPLQFFQPTGKILKELKNLVTFQINFENTSVNEFVNKEETKSFINTGSVFILLLVTTTHILLHSIIQRYFMPTNNLLKHKL